MWISDHRGHLCCLEVFFHHYEDCSECELRAVEMLEGAGKGKKVRWKLKLTSTSDE